MDLDVIKRKIREHMNILADDLASGVAVDYPHYRYITGMITGLAMVERDILDYEKTRQEDE